MTAADPGRAERGQATVEVVLILPVVVGLLLGLVQIGALARDRLLLTHVAREAARAAAVEPSPQAAAAAARSASGLRSDRLRVELGGGRGPGDRMTVTVGYLAPTDVPVVGRLLPDVALETDVTVRVE